MNTTENTLETRFIEPLDVLFLRGNKLFGDPGSYGESLVPPWPSVAAGAIRSRMLADEGVDLSAFAAGKVDHPTLGTPAKPGTFAVAAFHLARRLDDGRVEALTQLPADLVVSENEDGKPATVRALNPVQRARGLLASSPFDALPILSETTRGKPAGGYWLKATGWQAYLAGDTPQPSDLLHTSQLWRIDPRVGVGLDADTRRAADGRLFSVQAVAMLPGVGFLASVAGAMPPSDGTLRLGGDGRAAALRMASVITSEADYAAIAHARRCRLVLSTPGLFAGGWQLPGTDNEGRFSLGDVSGRLVCAAVPRADVVSGWDLAQWQPKPAQRAAPAGSVYWLEDLTATPEALRKLANAGLWDAFNEDAQRCAEGFNRCCLAAWF